MKAGFGEVRFHLSGNWYDPFIVRGGQVYERPLADALVALNSWFPLGTTLHPVLSTSLTAEGVVAHAALRPDGTVVLILDDESARPAKVLLRGVSTAQLTTISALQDGMPTRTVTSPTAQVPLAMVPNEIVAVAGRP